MKVETAIKQTQGAIGFYSGELFKLAGEQPDHAELSLKAERIVAALESTPGFPQERGAAAMPATNGGSVRDLFARKLELELDAGLSAAEVVAEAEREAARVESEMALIARQMWGTVFPGKPLPLDDPDCRRADDPAGARRRGRRPRNGGEPGRGRPRHGRGDQDVYHDPQDPPADRARSVPDRRDARVSPRQFGRLFEPGSPPRHPRLERIRHQSPATRLEPTERAESYLREYNRAMLKILTIHEAYPGHYVQLEYSNRCPSLIRRVLSSGTFAEGWAVYTEQMMLDQGFGGGDLGLRLQQLKFYLRAVVNAILDHKMHAGNMSDAEAMDLLVGRAFQTEGEAVGKIIRAKQTSCQLSTYFVGRTAFYRLRQQLQRELGDRFDLASFHEAVLSHGTIPVKYLPELVRKSLGLPDQSSKKDSPL